MMDINVQWKDGTLDKYSTPIITAESTWDCLRVKFDRVDGRWMLAVYADHPEGSKKGAGWKFTKGFLAHDCAGLDAYLMWLEDRVEYITIDHQVWWAAPEAEEG